VGCGTPWNVRLPARDERGLAASEAGEGSRESGVRRHVIALRAAAVLLGVVVMWGRQPAFFSEPRFWAEEGRVFFARAWTAPWWDMLVAAPLLYLSFYTNLAVVLAANVVPLERAPLVTTLAALVAQTVPLVLLAGAVAPEWGDGRRYVAMAIVLFASLTDEIWLTTLHSHYYFALIAFVILLEPGNVGRVRAVVYATLTGLAGLSGPVPCFLVPLFAWKAYRSRNRADAWQLGALAAATLVHVVAALTHLIAHHKSVAELVARGPAGPAAGLGVAGFPCILWMKMIVLPIAGVDTADAFGGACESITRGTSVVADSIFAAALLAQAGFLLVWLGAGLPRRWRGLATGSFVLIATSSILLSFGDKRILLESAPGSSRYAYVPGVILLLLLLQNVWRAPGESPSLRNVVAAVLLAVGLVGGLARYRETVRWRPSWPSWRSEVEAWRKDPNHALRIWPQSWAVRLSPDRR
jgi:hypothetical protein